MRVQISDRDLGWGDLMDAIGEPVDAHALAGIRQEAGAAPGGQLSIAEIAAVNEYGTRDGRIPSRPAYRQAWDAGAEGYARELARQVGLVIDGDKTFAEALDRVILQVERDQVESVISLSDPPNAPATLAAKAPKSNPLINTSQTVQSIDSAVYQDGSIVRPWKRGS